MSPTTYELFAVKYAELSRPAVQNFAFAADVHDGPMPLDFFTWIARSPERTFIIDTGFDEADRPAARPLDPAQPARGLRRARCRCRPRSRT